MTLMISPKTADIWAGGGIIGFVAANAVQIEPIMHVLAEGATFLVALIAIVARLRKNKQEKKRGE